MGKLPIRQFQGPKMPQYKELIGLKTCPLHSESLDGLVPDGVSASEAHLVALEQELREAKTYLERKRATKELHQAQRFRKIVEKTIENIVRRTKREFQATEMPIPKKDQLNCFENVFQTLKKTCWTPPNILEFGPQLSNLHGLCKEGYPVDSIGKAIRDVCQSAWPKQHNQLRSLQ